MKKIMLVVFFFLAIGLIAFYIYTQSGGELNEAPPQTDVEMPATNTESVDEMMKMEISSGENMDETLTTMQKQLLADSIENADTTTASDNMPQMMSDAPRQGSFNTVDFIHKASGMAKIFSQTADGPVLRLENFDVTNGPDLYVYLSKNNDVSEDGLGEYVEVSRLKASSGNQNYNIPMNHADYQSVVIWCKAYKVLFSYAVLEDSVK